MTNLPPNVYHLSQGQFSAILGNPWVYWISDNLRHMFSIFPVLDDLAHPAQGLASADNQRFLRFWWEVGHIRIEFDCKGSSEAKRSKKRWFPCMKGGAFQKWYGNQEFVVNWESNGREMRVFEKAFIRNDNTYFREGITFTDLSSGMLSMRYLPPGFVYDHAGNSLFAQKGSIWAWLSLLNSKVFGHLMHINPTIHFYIGDFKRMPIPLDGIYSDVLIELAQTATKIAICNSFRIETTFKFISPTDWRTGIEDNEKAQTQIDRIATIIDEKVNVLYQLTANDIAAIEKDWNRAEFLMDEDENFIEASEETELKTATDQKTLAIQWLSYSIGIILGRFRPVIPDELGCAVYHQEDFAIGSLPFPNEVEFDDLIGPPERFAYIDETGGRHVFSREVEEKLRALADSDGIAVLDQGHPDDLPAKVETALELMLGEAGAAEVIAAATGESHGLSTALRRFLERRFFTQWHLKQYRKRPVYWLLQSPQRLYGLYLFHERLTRDTLFVVQRQYVDRKINLTRQQLAEQRAWAEKASTARERRELNKQAEDLERLLLDVEEFARRLKAITGRGYSPHIDDGVILNMAPLWEIIPSWSKEPKKYWDGLERGDYDWAHLAMDYWPQRVREKCRTDKSLAIAHGHEEWYEGK